MNDTFSALQIWLYPLGFLSSIPFFLRFLIQWLKSEKAGRSYVPAIFWHLSLAGNCLLFLHGWIQQQLPLFLAQGLSGLIAWRNLDLMKNRSNPDSFKKIFLIFCTILTLCFGLFFIPNWLFEGAKIQFLRVPLHSFQNSDSAPISFHLIGILGQALFSIRFLVQWWQAEHRHRSELSRQFWWISLLGGSLSLAYAILIVDIVNILGPLFNLVPTIRNLLLLEKQEKKEEVA